MNSEPFSEIHPPARLRSTSVTEPPEPSGLEAALWRGVVEQPSLGGALAQVHRLLSGFVPIATLSLYAVEREPSRLVLTAQEPPSEAARAIASHELDADLAAGLASWFRDRGLIQSPPNSPLSLMLAPRLSGARIYLSRLETRQGPRIVALVLTPGSFLDTAAERAFLLCREPLKFACEREHDARELSELRALAHRAPGIDTANKRDVVIGVEGGLREVMGRVELVARTRAPVLILGETGAGKEVIARALHQRSACSSGPLVRVNCGAIPPELVDSELFGHERGSFTGAVANRQGWFERAHGGTLFLDEVGELPPAAQVRLLRVLQDGNLERVGGQRTLHVDVRVVAATHRNVEAMVQAGTFRQDLWYRLSVFPIRLPALRERPGDIPALAAHFVAQAGRRLGVHGLSPTDQDVKLLMAYDWPGNVRELVAVIERATILGKGIRLEVERALGVRAPIPDPSAPPSTDVETDEQNVIAPLEQIIVRHIERALYATGGRIEGPFGAAHMLRVNPHTLRARMRKLDIDWSRFRPQPAFGNRAASR
jgi:hydrogenase-4 transcriptional activator